MKIIVPDGYEDFSCIADRCKHTCCAGWEIDIDEDSLEYYETLEGPFGDRVRTAIETDDETAHFRLCDGERCPFLNGNNLCDMILELGEDALCDICADHPRYRFFFTDRVETGLGLCCEEAARQILSRTEPFRLTVLGEDANDEMPEACESFFLSGMPFPDESTFLRLRDDLITHATDRTLPLEARVGIILDRLHAQEVRRSAAEWSDILRPMERLSEQWTDALDVLKSEDPSLALPDFDDPLALPAEQFLTHSLFRHLSGALDDGLLHGRTVFCIVLTRLLCALTRLSAAPDIVECARLLSSELEYSDENTAALFELLEITD